MLNKLLMIFLFISTPVFADTGIIKNIEKSGKIYLLTLDTSKGIDKYVLCHKSLKAGDNIDYKIKEIRNLYKQDGNKITIIVPKNVEVM